MTARRFLVIGATSAVAEQTVRLWAAPGCHFDLIGRSQTKLQEVAEDLASRGATTNIWVHDARDAVLLDRTLPQILERGCNVVLCCHGILGDTERAEADDHHALEILEINFTATVRLLNLTAKTLADAKKPATIAVVSSVAGDRGRQSNYFYGAAKGGLSIFLAGLRNRYAKRGVHVLTIKPGFIATPMTSHLPKNALFVSPAFVAAKIATAVKNRRNVIYVPGIWRLIMLVIKSIPEAIFKRLSL